MTTNSIKTADAALEQALRQRITAGNAAAVDALRQLVQWVPEDGYQKDWPLAYVSKSEEQEAEERERLNDGCPFATEAYTYQLFGKCDARTYLGYLDALARALGLRGIDDLAVTE